MKARGLRTDCAIQTSARDQITRALLSKPLGEPRDGSGELTDAILTSLTVGGTPADGARAIGDWTAAGADTIVLVAGADEPVESYRRFAQDVFPLIGRPRSDQAPAGTSVG